LLATSHPESVAAAAIEAAVTLKLTAGAPALHAAVADAAQRPDIRAAALKALDTLGDAKLADAVATALAADAGEVRLAALSIATRLQPQSAVAIVEKLLAGGTPAEQRAAFVALGAATDPRADELILAQLARLAAGQVARNAQLDLLDAAAKRSDPRIKEALAAREAALAADSDPLAAWRVALEGGSARRGAQLFQRHPVVTCARCHRTGDNAGSEAGPNLAGIGARESRDYILQSILKPSAKIAPGFAIATVTRKNGEAVVGTIVDENAQRVRLKIGDDAPFDIARSDIAGIELAPSAMPEIAVHVLSKSEVRDLVESVASLRRPARPRDQIPVRALLAQPEL
jgi:quinoprotein glucose dehydrogenase